MPEIITEKNSIAVCPKCRRTDFDLIKHPEIPDSPMAFCYGCGEGRALDQITSGEFVGTVNIREFLNKYYPRETSEV